MKVKSVLSIFVLIAILTSTIPALALIDANKNIAGAGITLNSSMNARFECSANDDYNISVYSVKLEVKNTNGTWSSAGSLSSPPSASNTSNYTKSVNYASSCTKGKTYRIKATFDADGETVNRTSNEMTYR